MRIRTGLTPLSLEHYLRLRDGARVIESDRHGDKVLQLADGTYLKLFRRKRLLTSAMFYPYARRFADNIGELARRGIPCPSMVGLYRIAAIQRDAVHYRPLAGRTLRQIIGMQGTGPDEYERLRSMLGEFVSALHANGIYFRSLHLGNIVLTPQGRLGLIDVADMKVRPRSLSLALRKRNIRHLLRYREEGAWLCSGPEFYDAYHRTSGYRLAPDHA